MNAIVRFARNAAPEIFVSFELQPAEIQQLRDLNWRNGRADLMCQSIVRDYLLRMRLKADRIARKAKCRNDRKSA